MLVLMGAAQIKFQVGDVQLKVFSPVILWLSGTMVTMIGEGLQSLTSDGATLAVQQVMLGGHSEDESGDSGDDDDDADMAGLGLDNSDSLQ